MDEIESLVKDLTSANPATRDAAMAALLRLGPAAVDELGRVYTQGPPHMRCAVVPVFGRLGSEGALRVLFEAIKDTHSIVRREAAVAMGRIGAPQAMTPLIAALRDQDPQVRRAAAEALGRFADDAAVEWLTHLLRDFDAEARCAAVMAVRSIFERIEPACAAGGVDWFVRALRDSILPIEARTLAATTLGEMATAEAIAALIASLSDRVGELRVAAARALAIEGNERAVAPLVAALNDDLSTVRITAAHSLGRIRSPSALAGLNARLPRFGRLIVKEGNREVEAAIRAAIDEIETAPVTNRTLPRTTSGAPW